MRKCVYVTGKSMEPTLVEGQLLSCNKSRKAIRNIKIGDIIVCKHDSKLIIKRVTRLFEKAYFVVGDNKAHSTDSRAYGAISRKDVIGVIDMADGTPIVLDGRKLDNGRVSLSFKDVYNKTCQRLGI